MVRVVVACAPFKGTLSATRATRLVADQLRHRGFDVDERPLPDGGEGTADVLAKAWDLTGKAFMVREVLGQPADAETRIHVAVGIHRGRRVAVVESARCVGLGLVAPAARNPLQATTRSLGHLLRAVLEDDTIGQLDELVLCLGGTGTVDGGRGLLEVLPALPALPRGLRLTGLVDVDAPLCGPTGARRFFAQKGVLPADVERVEEALASLHPRFVDVPGAGAAGGLGAAVLALGGTLRSGADVVIEDTGIEGAVASADVVVGGEGAVDVTTTAGKSLWRLRRLAHERQRPLVVVCGRCELDPASVADAVIELGARGLKDADDAIARMADDVAAAVGSVVSRET